MVRIDTWQHQGLQRRGEVEPSERRIHSLHASRSWEKASSAYSVEGRAANAALLIWFLQHVKRLDEDEAVDAVCDGPQDKGAGQRH